MCIISTRRAGAAPSEAGLQLSPAICGGPKGEIMKTFLAGSVTAAALVFSGFTAGNALAQDKKADKGAPKAVIKVVAENAKVVAAETTYAPGAESNTSRAET